jgi:hypothetical protein
MEPNVMRRALYIFLPLALIGGSWPGNRVGPEGASFVAASDNATGEAARLDETARVDVNLLPSSYDAGAVVAGLARLHARVDEAWEAPASNRETDPRDWTLDVMDYFTVLSHLGMPRGLVLDHVHCEYGGDGLPALYVREAGAPRFETCSEYLHARTERERDESGHGRVARFLVLDGSPESFFELVVFTVMAGQFRRVWHANYNDMQVVTDLRGLEDVVSRMERFVFSVRFSREEAAAARALDFTAHVSFPDEGTAEVSVVTFTKWGGFARVTRQVSRGYPHLLGPPHVAPVMKFDCGIMF